MPGFHHDVMAAPFVLFLTLPCSCALGPELARLDGVLPTSAITAVLCGLTGSSLVLPRTGATSRLPTQLAPGDGERSWRRCRSNRG